MVKKSVWIATGAGLLATVAALIIQMNYVILQTEPAAVNSVISGTSAVLLITGSVLFSAAFWDLKHKINRTPVIILIAIGLIGIGGILAFQNILVDFVFPRLSIITFLLVDFMAVALTGIFLSILGKRAISDNIRRINLDTPE